MPDESADGAALEISTTRDGTAVVVAVAGELDAHSAPALEAVARGLIGEGCESLTLELSGTTFVDSAGLRTLIALHTELLASGAGGLGLRRPSDPVVRLLTITGLTEHFLRQ